MEGENNKRKRNVNFSKREEELLVELVRKRRDVIENKRTDVVMWRDKESCWEEVAIEFNSNALLVPRTAQQLQLKYKSLKRNVRKKNAAVVLERRRTGGGANEKANLNDVEEKVEGMILLSFEGMNAEFDSDSAFEKRYKSMTAEPTNILRSKEEDIMHVKKKYMESEMELNEQKKINVLLERDVLTLERERKSLEIEKLKLEIRLLQDKVEEKQCSDSV